jgi:hypothetical protein
VEVFGPDGAVIRGSKTFFVLAAGRHVLKVYDSRQSRRSHFPFKIAVRLTQPQCNRCAAAGRAKGQA